METGKSLFSPTKVYESLKLLRRDQGVVEIRLLNAKQIGQNRTRAITGYFDFEHLKDAVRMLQSKVAEFDIMMATLNTINPALLARTGNGFAWDAEACSTSDGDVLRLQWLVVDLDPIRPSGISSNDAEHEAAHALATSVQVHLHGLGFPDPIVNDSGNGAHLIYPIDLPASDASLVKDCLEALAGLHDSSLVKVDTTLGNASRLLKIPGVYALKGTSTTERPHRLSKILHVPDTLMPVSRELLASLASMKPDKASPKPKPGVAAPGPRSREVPVVEPEAGDSNDLQHLTDALQRSGLKGVVGPSRWETKPGTSLWKLVQCPFDENHLDSASVIRFPDGGMHFKCFHNSCSGYKWNDVVGLLPELAGLERRNRKATSGADQQASDSHAGLESLTEDGVARLLEEALGGELRYSPAWKSWLRWDGRRWVLDGLHHAQRKLDGLIRNVIADLQALNAADPAFIKKCRSARFRTDVLRLAESKMVYDITLLDADPWLLNVQNCVLDLRSGDVLPHSPQFDLGKLARFTYDPAAKAKRFLEFIDQVTAGDRDLARQLQTALGYALTGSTKSHVAFFLIGEGSNGKSTLLELVMELLGDYAQVSPASLLTEQARESHPTVLANLEGSRFAVVNEIPMNARIDSARFKSLTGGDTIPVHLMYKDFHPMTPRFKLFIATNHLPRIADNSDGMWRRVVVIPFNVKFVGDACDQDLKDKLVQEGAGILNWLLEGVRAWQAGGIIQTQNSKVARETYRQGEDLVGQFIDERLQEAPGQRLLSAVVYKLFQDWAGQGREQVMNSNAFGRALTAHSLVREKIGGISYLMERSLKIMANRDIEVELLGEDEDPEGHYQPTNVVPLQRAAGDGSSTPEPGFKTSGCPSGTGTDDSDDADFGDPVEMAEIDGDVEGEDLEEPDWFYQKIQADPYLRLRLGSEKY